ncbi:MAG TPA: STAS domain-containing protein [Rhodocyclaceae bacterium]|nr:STAS domain-containing protein [Rhodocyclaceae bacterium]
MSVRDSHSIDRNLTIYEAHELKAELLGVLGTVDELDLDLSDVAEIDTAGIQVLLVAKQEAARHGKCMRIVAHSAAVSEVIDFYNLAAHFGDPLVIPADKAV